MNDELHAEIVCLKEASHWIPVELLLPCRCDLGSPVEFKDKNGVEYRGHWNCGFITNGKLFPNEDIILWRYQREKA
jgi:hypothetical protein